MADPNKTIKPAIKAASLKYPGDLDQYEVAFNIQLKPYYSTVGGTGGNIYLPMPSNGLIDSYHIKYEEQAMGAIGGVAATFKDPTVAGVVGGIGSGLALFAKSVGQSALEALGSEVGLGGVGTAAGDLAAGFINNPNYAILFKGITPRTFSFSWTLVAKNAAESNAIDKLVKTLKKAALPEKQFGANFALNYPSIAYLKVLGQGTSRYITFAKEGAFIENVEVNYSGGGYPAFFKGDLNPVRVDIKLDFRERSIVTSNDIEA
jgi:hypothetical protein